MSSPRRECACLPIAVRLLERDGRRALRMADGAEARRAEARLDRLESGAVVVAAPLRPVRHDLRDEVLHLHGRTIGTVHVRGRRAVGHHEEPDPGRDGGFELRHGVKLADLPGARVHATAPWERGSLGRLSWEPDPTPARGRGPPEPYQSYPRPPRQGSLRCSRAV